MNKFIISIICLLTTVSAKSQTSKEDLQMLSLNKAQELALDYNKSISKSKIKFEQTGYDVETYRSNRLPRVELLLTDIYSTARSNFKIEGGHLPLYNYNVTAGAYVPSVQVNTDGSYTLLQYADFPSQTYELKLKNMFIGGLQVTQPIYTGGKISTEP